MGWDVEYTDQFGDWWEGLDAKEQASVSASVDLLELFGPGLRFPIAATSKARDMATCESCGSSMRGGLIVCCMRLILVDALYF
ncbi:hypothetical protein D3C76_927540 [compost metagenome]